MSDIAIRVDHLSKLYHIGRAQQRHDTLRDAIADVRRKMEDGLRRRRDLPSSFSDLPSDTDLWALKDVSFEVQRGEVVGVIGRNGAGKSTLLKILSRITEPTSGRAEIHGRVGSLLEVGTGFHPELTGRENIYLNGAILGMKRREIEAKFDEIVAFAAIERFLDTPVKRYSSGMYVRLAFAVAAHLEPEILLVDEVLAVGDAQFQKKCLGKMGDVARGGRTVLFVSHNMGAITQLCPNSLLLRFGIMAALDRSDRVVQAYLGERGYGQPDVQLDPASQPDSAAVFTRCWICATDGTPISSVTVDSPISVGLQILVRKPVVGVELSVRVYNSHGEPLFTTNLSSHARELASFLPGEYIFFVELPAHFLAPDRYSLHVGIHRPFAEILDAHDHLLTFSIEESGSDMWQYLHGSYGNILVQFPWKHSLPKVQKSFLLDPIPQ